MTTTLCSRTKHEWVSVGVAKIERIGTVSIFPFTRQLFTNTSFPYVAINVIPLSLLTKVDRKPLHGVDGAQRPRLNLKLNLSKWIEGVWLMYE